MQYDLSCTEQGKILGITAKMANRHGLIAGATGTGKTVTLRKLLPLTSVLRILFAL